MGFYFALMLICAYLNIKIQRFVLGCEAFNMYLYVCTYKVCVILKGIMKICDPSSITKHQNISFLLKASSFSPFQHFPFIENFKCIHFLCVSHFNNTNFSKCSSSDHFENFKVFLAQPQWFYFVGHRFYWKEKMKI